jgi:hypothetical protein
MEMIPADQRDFQLGGVGISSRSITFRIYLRGLVGVLSVWLGFFFSAQQNDCKAHLVGDHLVYEYQFT